MTIIRGRRRASYTHPPAFGSPNDRSPEIFVDRPSKFGSTSSEKTVTLIRNSAATEPSAGSWARKPDKHAGLVGQLSQVEQQTLGLKLLT